MAPINSAGSAYQRIVIISISIMLMIYICSVEPPGTLFCENNGEKLQQWAIMAATICMYVAFTQVHV